MHFLISCITYFFPLANVYLSSLDTLDAVSRQFTDEFRIQDIPQQHIRMSRFRAIKASLFRCMKDGAGQAVDCYVCQLLVAIAAAFRSLLKSSHTAAEQLASKLFFFVFLFLIQITAPPINSYHARIAMAYMCVDWKLIKFYISNFDFCVCAY